MCGGWYKKEPQVGYLGKALIAILPFKKGIFDMFSLYFLVAFFISSVSAHFQLQYPVPRGPFVEDNEPTFCDGYTDAVSNRTVFPLSNSFITLNSEHPVWTLGVLISLEQDPTNFTVFNHTSNGTALPLAKPFFQTTGEGVHCVPLDLSSLGISGLGDGSNVTIQIEFSGGDGSLFQCADLTLSSNATIPSDVQCTNVVGNTTTSSSSSSTTSPTASPSTTQSSGFLVSANSVTVLLAVAAVSIFVF